MPIQNPKLCLVIAEDIIEGFVKLDVFAGDSVSVVFHRDNLLLSGAFLVMKPDVLHF